MGEEDADLLAAVSKGSERAFNLLVDRRQREVRNFLRGVVGQDEADDIAQETFLAVWTDARSFRGGAPVRSWLFGIAWRKAKGAQRGWFRRRARDTAWSETVVEAHRTSDETRHALRRG